MGPTPNIFVHGDIGFLRLPIVKSYGHDSKSGRKSRLQPWPPEESKEVSPPFPCPGIASVQIS